MNNLIFWLYIVPAVMMCCLKLIAIVTRKSAPELDTVKGVIKKLFWVLVDALMPVFNLLYLLAILIRFTRVMLHQETTNPTSPNERA